MPLKITKYGVNNKYTVTDHTDNISDVIDKMIRLVAKLTERWASDIVYDIESLKKAVENEEHFDRILFFRENGVTAWETSELDDKAYNAILINFTPIQTWRLTHNPDIMLTKLERVDIFKDRNPFFIDNNTK